MNRDELINKLHKIDFGTMATVETFDMGLQYDYVTPDGCGTGFGNMGEWPAFKLQNINRLKLQDIQNKVDDNSLKSIDLEGTSLLDFYNYVTESESAEIYRDEIVMFFSDILTLNDVDDNSLYALCDRGAWEPQVQFFNDYDSMESAFIREYTGSITPWEELDDNELEEWWNVICEGLQGISQIVI